jgi:poly [ADP-ribose] polymerase
MLEALRDIELASKLIGSTGDDTDEDPLDVNYRKLKCDIIPLPHDSDEFKLIKKYLERTHAPTHTVECNGILKFKFVILVCLIILYILFDELGMGLGA